jgi:hypothetical protein
MFNYITGFFGNKLDLKEIKEEEFLDNSNEYLKTPDNKILKGDKE